MVAQIVSAAGAGGDGSWRSAPAARQRARGAMYASRCLAQALVCSSAALQQGWLPHQPLGNCPATPFPGTPSGTGTGACLWARLCVHTAVETQPSVETAHAETARRPRPAQTGCPRNHHHFRLQPQHRSSAALISPATRLARVAPQQGGRRPCLVVRRMPCAEIDSWAKKRKNNDIPNPRNNRFSPPRGGLGGKRVLPHEFCTL